MPYSVYVIALRSEFAVTAKARKTNPGYLPGKRCYYVGYTSKPVMRRYIQHISGTRNEKGPLFSRVVKKYGIYPNGLRPGHYQKYNPIATKEEAMKQEVALANKLRSKGHCVWQN
jgi:predicted GIY-YIG superfamily endonuclease